MSQDDLHLSKQTAVGSWPGQARGENATIVFCSAFIVRHMGQVLMGRECDGGSDLAAAGFFYVPMPGCEDRVACYACGKVGCAASKLIHANFFSWLALILLIAPQINSI